MPMIVLLFFLQLVWASSYTAQKIILIGMPVGLVLILRYGLASLVFALFGKLNFKAGFSAREWGLIALGGVINFSGSPFFQLQGLRLTNAIDTSLLVSFEPLLTALMAALLLKERPGRRTWVAFAAATIGVMLLSGWPGHTALFPWERFWGNLLFLTALLCEATCSTLGRSLSQKKDPYAIIAWMIFFGFLFNLATNFGTLKLLQQPFAGWKTWATLVYLTLFCSVLGYGGWFYLLKKTPLSKLALSLFLQPILGTLLASLFLGEQWTLNTLFGGGVVLLSLGWWMRAFPKSADSDKRRGPLA